MTNADLIRELQKIHDTLVRTHEYLYLQARANAALHMAREIRPAPLVGALSIANANLDLLIQDLESGASHAG